LRAESCPTDFLEHQSARSAAEHICVQDFLVRLARDRAKTAALSFGHADHHSGTTGCAGSTGWAGRARWTLIAFFTLHRLAIATRGKKHAKKSYRQNVPHIRPPRLAGVSRRVAFQLGRNPTRSRLQAKNPPSGPGGLCLVAVGCLRQKVYSVSPNWSAPFSMPFFA
jgi:hypothetical protein